MKLYIIILVGILFVSCEKSNCSNGIKDGEETGIDCGGDCQSCVQEITEEVNNENNVFFIDSLYGQNETFKKIQGLWYTNSKIIRNYNSNSDTIDATIHVYKNQDYKTNFTDTIQPNSLIYFLKVKGNIIDGNYDENVYKYDSIQNSIVINNDFYKYSISNITDNDLNLELGNNNSDNVTFEYLLTRSKPYNSSTETINWKVDLLNSYPNNNEIKILLQYRSSSYDPLQSISIPIQAGQLNYSGSINLNSSFYTPYFQVSIVTEDINSPNNYNANFKTSISWKNTVINTSYLDRIITRGSLPLTSIVFY